jgi:murein DD-endopeptidase MepM/ murein hydrolase activator NlpD
VTGIPDQEIGSMDHYFVPGNTVVIDHGQGEFSFLCHLQKGSIVVKPGQGVRRGQLLGKVGNSGNTTAPHLHWHLGSDADVTRASGLPIRFGPLEVNGVRLEAPAPKQGDTVENP